MVWRLLDALDMGTRALATVAAMWATVAQAAPGDAFGGGDGTPSESLTIVAAIVRPCASKPGAACWTSGARSTVAVASEPVAASATKVPVVARFARAASSEGKSGPQPWTLELSATLKHPSWPGNVIVMLIDTDDPEAVQARQFTALYQASVKALRVLNARLVLSPEEGYRPGHTYHALVLQLIEGKEILLAEGEVTLL